MINDVSGAGNNWAHGNHYYGPKYKQDILEKIRKVAEECDSLQSFFVLHSLGGGTGSGLGTYIIQRIISLKIQFCEITILKCLNSQLLFSRQKMMTWLHRPITGIF
jgi:hypothetical protein